MISLLDDHTQHWALCMTGPDSDRLLVEQIRAGDPDAWRTFINRFEGRLFAYAQARLSNAPTAEDVVQETMLGFLTSLPHYDEQTPVESYLYSIAAHKLTDVLRRQGRRPALHFSATSNAGADALPGNARHASSLARSGERKEQEESVLAQALDELVTEWKTTGHYERLKCIELLFVLGWTNQRVAQTLNLSEQSVANHKHYVMRKLQNRVNRQMQNTRFPES